MKYLKRYESVIDEYKSSHFTDEMLEVIIPVLKSKGFISYEEQLELISDNKEHVQSIINYFNDDILELNNRNEILIQDKIHLDRLKAMKRFSIDRSIFTNRGISDISDKNDILIGVTGYPVESPAKEVFKRCCDTLENYYKTSKINDVEYQVILNLSNVKYYRIFKNCIECFSGTYFVEGDGHKSLNYVDELRKEINSNFSEFRMQGYRLEHSYDYNTIHFRVSKKEK